jgi:hypothetical protein
LSPPQRLLAGAAAGIVDVWACHWVDRIKTQKQQFPSQSIPQCYRDIINKGGGTGVISEFFFVLLKSQTFFFFLILDFLFVLHTRRL